MIALIIFSVLFILAICFIIKRFSDFRRCNGYGRIFKKEYHSKNLVK